MFCHTYFRFIVHGLLNTKTLNVKESTANECCTKEIKMSTKEL